MSNRARDRIKMLSYIDELEMEFGSLKEVPSDNPTIIKLQKLCGTNYGSKLDLSDEDMDRLVVMWHSDLFARDIAFKLGMSIHSFRKLIAECHHKDILDGTINRRSYKYDDDDLKDYILNEYRKGTPLDVISTDVQLHHKTVKGYLKRAQKEGRIDILKF